MKKFLLFMGGAAIGLAVQAQSLPRPVYMLDFEGAKAVASTSRMVGLSSSRME